MLEAYVIIAILLFLYNVAKAIFIFKVLPKFYSPKLLSDDKNGWALVTGCTDGIGKAIVQEFLHHQIPTIMISRSETKLKYVSEEFTCLYPQVDTKFFPFDFTSTDYSRLAVFLKDYKVEILVNNVGVTNHLLLPFLESSDLKPQEILRVNLLSYIRMTELVLPQMMANNYGRIVNLSSIIGRFPFGYAAAYGATKHAIIEYSKALSSDRSLRDRNVLATCICPHLVATKLAEYNKATWYVTDKHVFARQAIGTIGILRETTGCFYHEFQFALGRLLPNCMFEWILELIGAFEGSRRSKHFFINKKVASLIDCDITN